MSDSHVEQLLALIQKLPVEEQFRLVSRVTEALVTLEPPPDAQPLRYGQFKSDRVSSEADFIKAQWRPMRRKMNGS